jgi:hypothetical protein
MWSQNPDKWFDYNFKTSNFDLNSDTPLREQWDSLSDSEKWEEMEMTFDTIRDANLVIQGLETNNANLKKELEGKGTTWLDAKFGYGKSENN